MKMSNPVHDLKKQTKPTELTPMEIDETTAGIVLYYKGGRFIQRDLINQPGTDTINPLTRLEKNADVFFKTIRMIDSSIFHIKLTGNEDNTREMCSDSVFYRLLRGIGLIFNAEQRSRTYLELSGGRQQWDILVSLDKQTYCLANNVCINGKEVQIHNVLAVGNRLIGLTEKKEAVIGRLTSEVIEKSTMPLDMELMDEINNMGKVEQLQYVPNSDETFLAYVRNYIYQCNLFGEIVRGNKIKQRNSENFDYSPSAMAVNSGLDRTDAQELPAW